MFYQPLNKDSSKTKSNFDDFHKLKVATVGNDLITIGIEYWLL